MSSVKTKNQKGVSLFLSILILTVLLVSALGISTILVGQTRMLIEMGDSVQAFFAADTGIERALFEERSVSGTLPNNASYQVQLVNAGPNCNAASYCLRAVGAFRNSRRAIEITR